MSSRLLEPGAEGYELVYNAWLADHEPGTVERLALGWQYRAIWPDTTAVQPTFTLVASNALTDADNDGPPRGYSGDLATRQSSLPGGQRNLPKE